MSRKELRKKQWEVITMIEKSKTLADRKNLIKKLETLEARGDKEKGLATQHSYFRYLQSLNIDD